MNYYKRHLGDYARKAGHLSMLEHGAYNLILDAYYDREQAPTRQEAMRYARARSDEEIRAVDVVLEEFFTERDGRFYQTRVEEEFAAAAEIAERNKANGSKGGRPRKGTQSEPNHKPKKTHSVSDGLPDGKREESQTKGNPLIHESINPNQEQEHGQQAARTPSRFDEFWAVYPNKKGKADAAKAWKRKRLDAKADEIIADVKARMKGDGDWLDGFIPHGSTYVNGERWLDDIVPPKRNGQASAGGYVALPGEI